jgi:hypothetical protein
MTENEIATLRVSSALVPTERIEQRILLIRGHRVMFDCDLAALYGVATKRFNEQVKRNLERFPLDFMFQLTREEKLEVVANCDHLKRLKFSHSLPYGFTEHGAIMAANVLNSPLAVQTSVLVVRAFVRLRQMLVEHAKLSKRLDTLEEKYDAQFKAVFDAIRALMAPPAPKRRSIGFGKDE